MRVVKLHSLIKNDATFQNPCQAFLTNFFVFFQLFFVLFSPLPFCVSLAPFLLYFFAFVSFSPFCLCVILLCYYGHFCSYYARVLYKVFTTLLPLENKRDTLVSTILGMTQHRLCSLFSGDILASLDVTQTCQVCGIGGHTRAVGTRCDTLRLGGVIPNPKGVRESLYFSNGSYMIIKPYEICSPISLARCDTWVCHTEWQFIDTSVSLFRSNGLLTPIYCITHYRGICSPTL